MSESERAEMAAERQKMNEELANVAVQRAALEQEREEFTTDRKKHSEETQQLQLKINSLEKVGQ